LIDLSPIVSSFIPTNAPVVNGVRSFWTSLTTQAGQERFMSIVRSYYLEVSAVIFAFDLSKLVFDFRLNLFA
jgi:hypothetical protein